MRARADDCCFALQNPGDLHQIPFQRIVFPSILEVLQKPARTFDAYDSYVLKAGDLEFRTQFVGMMKVRSGEVLLVAGGVPMLPVHEIAIANRYELRIQRKPPTESIQRGGVAGDGGRDDRSPAGQDAKRFPQRRCSLGRFSQVIQPMTSATAAAPSGCGRFRASATDNEAMGCVARALRLRASSTSRDEASTR